MLEDGQVQVRDLIMGEGTNYEIIQFNPWQRSVRHNQQPRPWNHGAWSGAEFYEAVTVNLTVCSKSTGGQGADCGTLGDFDTWIRRRNELTSAFRPIADQPKQIELHFRFGSTEYVMFGRPRMVDPNPEWLSWVRPGGVGVDLAFEALDPLIYSGRPGTAAEPHCVSTGLPRSTGGLTVPFTVPFVIGADVDTGAVTAVNQGTAEVGLQLRIDGPVIEPRVAVQRADGLVQEIRFMLELGPTEWLDVDTKARTVLLNGTASRRGQASGVFPLLAPGSNEIRFNAAEFDADAFLTACWRDAYL